MWLICSIAGIYFFSDPWNLYIFNSVDLSKSVIYKISNFEFTHACQICYLHFITSEIYSFSFADILFYVYTHILNLKIFGSKWIILLCIETTFFTLEAIGYFYWLDKIIQNIHFYKGCHRSKKSYDLLVLDLAGKKRFTVTIESVIINTTWWELVMQITVWQLINQFKLKY